MKPGLITLGLLIIACTVIAQDIERWIETEPRVLFEKVYIQTDRELYSPGDTIWFKSYLVGGVSNKLIPGFKNIYLQLLSSQGEVITNRLLLSEYGESYGDIALSDTLPEGKYILRARTKYLENFGEESYFHKRIWINKVKSSLELEYSEEESLEEIEAMYFPEGGNLVSDAVNHVAFKVIDTDGSGVEASGVVINQNNDTITRFSTSFLGMGRFVMIPKEGEKYYAVIDNYSDSKQELGNILDDGFVLNFKDEGDEVLISASRDLKQNGQARVYLSVSYKGLNLFHEQIPVTGFTGAVRINKSRFQRGINKITLSDSYYNILAERLVYIDVDYGNTVKVETAKGEYSTREKVTLNIKPLLPEKDTVTSTLSVSVISEDYLGAAGISQNILSYLLLDSELKGAIESPALYFIDEEKITASEKLDLLMMVQGWRSYYWEDIIEKAPEDLSGWDDAGINISGQVKRLFRDKKVDGGKVTLTSISPRLMVEETITDSLGYFSLDRLFLADSAEIKITATNEKGRKQVKVTTDSLMEYKSKVDTNLINQMLTGIGIPLKYFREIYLQHMAQKQFIPETGSIYIEEVDVVANRIDNFMQVEAYKPYNYLSDNTYLITKSDYKYKTLKGFLEKKAGLSYVGDFKLMPYPPINLSVIQYFLDGKYIVGIEDRFRTDETFILLDKPIQEIYQIDIEKGPWGVIKDCAYVYSNKFNITRNSSTKNVSVFIINGFQRPNKFYSPKYTLENINDKLPDYRPTLFWSPEVQIINGKGVAEFFTCDNLSNYLVVVEGISKNGNICYGLSKFSVTNRNNTNN